MIVETITYEDFDGTSKTDTLHFNLTELELTEIAMDLPDGLMGTATDNLTPDKMMATIVDKLGRKGVLDFIKQLVLKAYGIKTETGGFKKNPKITEEFSETLAFQSVVMQVLTDDNFAGKFFNGIIPAKLVNQIPADFQIAKK